MARPSESFREILRREMSTSYLLRDNPESSLSLVEFCIFDDLTVSYFEKEFGRL
jgi:hypothetical protein